MMSLEEFRKNRSAAKQSAILAAAVALFRRDGFAGASMEEVAAQAGVSTATLYRHFRSKADLFEAVAATSMATLETQLSLKPSSDPLDFLKTLAHAYANLLSEADTIGMLRMLIAETGRNADLADRFYRAVKSRLGDVFAATIQQLADAGLMADEPFDVAPGQLQGMIEHAILLRGLILGDEAGPAAPPDHLADQALATWSARWLQS